MKRIIVASMITISVGFGMLFGNNTILAKTGYSSRNSTFGRLKYTTTIPQKIRGNYYMYGGHSNWSKVKITAHAVRSGSGKNAVDITSYRHPRATRLAFAYLNPHYSLHKNMFTFQALATLSAYVIYAESGMALTHVNYKGKKIKAIRCYQNQGFSYDMVSRKVKHNFSYQN